MLLPGDRALCVRGDEQAVTVLHMNQLQARKISVLIKTPTAMAQRPSRSEDVEWDGTMEDSSKMRRD